MKVNDPDNENQSKLFIETAKELGCDEDEQAFDEKLKQILKKDDNQQKD
jgi:hypothetical protein